VPYQEPEREATDEEVRAAFLDGQPGYSTAATLQGWFFVAGFIAALLWITPYVFFAARWLYFDWLTRWREMTTILNWRQIF